MMKNWKKTAVAALAALTLTGSVAIPVMAHGHGQHHSYSQTSDYRNTCDYHGRNCDGNCDYRGRNCDGNYGANCDYRGQNCSRTQNDKKRSAKSNGYYCEYHDKTHKKKNACSNYCKKHKTIHANGKRHRVSGHTAS